MASLCMVMGIITSSCPVYVCDWSIHREAKGKDTNKLETVRLLKTGM